ncbi:MAG: hypothetical protein ACYTA3_08485 [Planctomycetota bacterium]
MKRTFKISGWCLAALAAYCVLHVLLVVFPQPLFRHHRTYKNFTVYMRQEVPPEITDVLDRVDTLLAASEINDPNAHHQIFLCNSYRLSRYLFLRNVHFGANLFTGATYITNANVAGDIAYCEKLGPNDTRVRTLSETIAHEITHDLIRDHLGLRRERKLPVWFKEGYCEVVAEGSAIDHELGLRVLKGESPRVRGSANFRYRMAVDYLIRDRHLTFDEIAQAPPDFGAVEAEVVDTLRADEQAFRRRLGTAGGPAASRHGRDTAADWISQAGQACRSHLHGSTEPDSVA